MDRTAIIHENFTHRVMQGDLPADTQALTPDEVELAGWEVADLFESQVMSRLLDIIARRLRSRNESFYTIGSAGHEGNVVFGKIFRCTDMAFLHYRSGGLLIQRSKQLPGETSLYNMLLSFVASSDDPVSGGRHKVLGSNALLAPPQTSTIASHLPKAMGAAYSIDLAKRLKNNDAVLPYDSIILCNFGDASANHSTTLGAINAAAWAAYQNLPVPVVFICEDNGIGISVRTPSGWIRNNFKNRIGIKYFYCDGLNLLDTFRIAQQAVHYARSRRKPVFLHVRTIRLMGHAGSDVESAYRTERQLEETEAQDPLLHSARILIENNIQSPVQICEMYTTLEARIERIAAQSITRPKLSSAAEVMASIMPARAASSPMPAASPVIREKLFAKEQRLLTKPQPMARLINLALADILLQYQNAIVFGEDVGRKGGVYSVTTGLHEKFGPNRVMDTLLDEQSILGLAIGLAHNGFIPVPEIQFLAYVHNAEDQIRGEAATLSFFSRGHYTNPMVIRVAGLAYQKGFGGHFHNDNSLAIFRDIPGLIIACPSNGTDAVRMLRSCIALAYEQRRIVVFVEPIALYMTRDLYEEGDGLWTSIYKSPADTMNIAPGEISVHGDGQQLCIISYANGYYLSLKAAKQLREKHGIELRVVDLRWLAPVDEHALIRTISSCQYVLIVDECRRSGSLSEALVAILTEHQTDVVYGRITAADSFIPLGDAANLVLPNVERIVQGALTLIRHNNLADAGLD